MKNFQRVELAPKETKTVTFKLKQADLAFWDVTSETFAVERGAYKIAVGSSAADIRKTKRIFVQGETIRERNLRRQTNAENYDDYKGVLITEESKYGGDAVKSSTANAWIAFHDVRFKGEKG